MFYSHEILTRREHGVATIWLVATLGSKSSLKKVTRKAINDVDVPKAVETIVSPDAPMALRLQGNLLFGVSRVYSQQCSYVQQDLQSFWDKLRHSSLVFGNTEIDLEAGRTRYDQLNLQDDPAFIPDLNINLDLSLFDLPLDRSFSHASTQLPSLAGSTRASLSDHEPQLELPSEYTSGLDIGGFEFGARTSSAGQIGSQIKGQSIFEEPGIIDDPDFDIDAEGNLFTPTLGQRNSNLEQDALAVLGIPGGKVGDSTGITDRVRAEHEAGLQTQAEDQSFVFNGQEILMGDDEPRLPDAAPFSARHSSFEPLRRHGTSAAQPESSSSSIIEVAPQRRVRGKPAIKPDDETQLPSKDLKAWDTNYLLNMARERQKKVHITSTLLQAKSNAEHLLLGIGLSGLGREFDADLDHPLRQAFGGWNFFDALVGKTLSPNARKRSNTSDQTDEADEDGRQVRPRIGDGPVLGQGEDLEYRFEDDEGIFAQGDDLPVEVGRHAPRSMPDVESIRDSMPWNVLASSRAGSAHQGRFTSSAGGLQGGFDFALGSPSAVGHRLTSASPLVGRGRQEPARYNIPKVPGASRISGDFGTFDDDGFQQPDSGSHDGDFELHGPAAGVSTQQANNNQWLASTLEDEANNFFSFLWAVIESRNPVLEKAESQELGSDTGEVGGHGMVTFEQLLPPESNSTVVGAQGLLHVLTLVTRGTVRVRQDEGFGEIQMSLAPGTKLVEGNQLEEEDDEMGVDDQEAEDPVDGDGNNEDDDVEMYD